MPSVKSVAFEEVDGVMVVAQSEGTARAEDSDAYFAALSRYVARTPAPRVLVLTLGGALLPQERKRLDSVIAPYRTTIRFAIVTDSTFARGVLAAIRIVQPCFRGFAVREIAQALRFLDVAPAKAESIRRTLATLSALCA